MHDADIATDTDPNALTIDELADMLGVSKWIAKGKLKALEKAGKAQRTIKRKPSSVGRMVEYVAYRLVQ